MPLPESWPGVQKKKKTAYRALCRLAAWAAGDAAAGRAEPRAAWFAQQDERQQQFSWCGSYKGCRSQIFQAMILTACRCHIN